MASTKKQGDVYVTLPDGFSGGEGQSILVGYVESGGLFPTTRPDGTALVLGDYVKPKGTVPFTIGTIIFSSLNDTAAWTGVEWMLNATQFQRTSETPVNNRPDESLSGTAEYQDDINKEFKAAINANTDARHTHANKSILDTISSSGTTGYVLKKTANGTEWAAENSTLAVTFTISDNVVSADKTIAQIVAALRASKPVIGFYENSDGYGEYEVTDCKSSGFGVKFTCINMGYEQTFVGDVDENEVDENEADVWTYTTKQGFTGASASANGTPGFVPAPSLGDQDKFLSGDGTWKNGMLPVSGTHTDEIAVLDSDGKVTYSGKTVEDFERADDDMDSAITGLLNPQTPSGLPMMAGQPSILFGNGTPQESVVPDNWKQYDPDTDTGYNWNGLPSVLGQQYINTAGGASGRYIGVKDGEYGLKWQNC